MTKTDEILLKAHHPEKWKEEQDKKQQELNDLLQFVEGAKAAITAMETKDEKKFEILFKSDKSSHCGFRPAGK
ncbi:hypothetical protein [Pseudomonas sp. PDM20]|uniref:hypothetical protein n=1 Tax=Pseudomonas sp. PDM20 TaxID=2769254 RepID=UPI001785DFDF|nr:hypothetical protein [Pseudomonas sp. PDM20]MBD9681437.1 hypothetical protein [Pseudomonas sp. PDM20]